MLMAEDHSRNGNGSDPGALSSLEVAAAAAREARVELIAVSLEAAAQLQRNEVGYGAEQLNGTTGEWPDHLPRG
jgi:hypothetical protein